ncbi:MAG TPA: hypothetical protein VLB51_11545 [Methylomirabilota bacterium]|nr:hypothetical protein [Methylomirabilota bacterium]
MTASIRERNRGAAVLAVFIGVVGWSSVVAASATDSTAVAPAPELVNWSEDFDSYAAGSALHGQGGWTGWFNDPAATAYVSALRSRSEPHSVDITGSSDMVHEFVAVDDGIWTVTAWQYIPSGYSGESYFILLNQYDASGAANNWSAQVQFDSATGFVEGDGVGAGSTLPLAFDRWVQIRFEIDLVADTQAVYYDHQLLYQGSWSNGVSGGGITSIGALNLFANGASSVFYDDLDLVEIPPAPDIDVTPTSLSSSLMTNNQATESLDVGNTGLVDLTWSLLEAGGGATPEQLVWSDNFDSYATGSALHGQGGWTGWFNDPAATAYVSSAASRSAPNSVDITGPSDMVYQAVGIDDGYWTLTAWQFIPTGFTGQSYFIVLNQYDAGGAGNNWSVQVYFDPVTSLIVNDGTATELPVSIVTNAWVELRLEIDLENDLQEFYYNGQLLYQGSWSNGVSGAGITSIGAINLFANGASSIYYDDLSLVRQHGSCSSPSDVPWLSVSPTMGVTAPGMSTQVDVTFDSTGMAVGTYEALLCITCDDPDEALVRVPVTMDVVIPVELMRLTVE